MLERLNDMVGNWYGRLEDITEELSEMGVDVENAYISRECIGLTVEDDGDDVDVLIRLGGTENTITVDRVEF